MMRHACSSDTAEICSIDARHLLVRASTTLAGIDYVEVLPDGVSLCVHFFGALPKNLTERNLTIEGGARIRDIQVVSARFHEHDNGDLCLLLRLDKTGDFSIYCLCLVEPDSGLDAVKCSYENPPATPSVLPPGIDPRYACVTFSFRLECAAGMDCQPAPCPPSPRPPLPPIDYLARDYESFRNLMLDRLAQTMPQWTERHLPDLGITVIEVFAYVADLLSYQLDSIATEAFLRTSRRRISVRRHARLVDYWMHEGCNARAWVAISSSADLTVPFRDLAFAAVPGDNSGRKGGAIAWNELLEMAGAVLFEPVPLDDSDSIEIVAAHSEIQFYTWQRNECCLPQGSTSATLDDGSGSAPGTPFQLHLQVDDVLVLEEIRGTGTGSGADAEPAHRHIVRLTQAVSGVDPLTGTRIWEIEWNREDALPFDLRLSVRTPAPECALKVGAVARGNLVLVDHGFTMDVTDTWVVAIEAGDLCCLCEGANTERSVTPVPLTIEPAQQPLTQAEPLPESPSSASAFLVRDPRAALPVVWLDAAPPADDSTPAVPPEWPGTFAWRPARDLLASAPTDRSFAVEIDDDGLAHLRFGDGLYGAQPDAGVRFRARQRVGNGLVGNVGHDAITWISRKSGTLSGMALKARNPLAATGGTEPESVDQVKLYAPHAYGRILERAVAAADYAQLAAGDPRVQGAFAELAWTGSWYEADVALDTVAAYTADEVVPGVSVTLERARRIGHDLRIITARTVPLDIALDICIQADHLRGDVVRAAAAILSSAAQPDGTLGMFHPDELQFGADIYGSRIVAIVQTIDGVVHVELTRFARLYASDADAAKTLDANIISIAPDEIARLDSDPNFPEHGRLQLNPLGGR
jgi:hypothetical protein